MARAPPDDFRRELVIGLLRRFLVDDAGHHRRAERIVVDERLVGERQHLHRIAGQAEFCGVLDVNMEDKALSVSRSKSWLLDVQDRVFEEERKLARQLGIIGVDVADTI